ncbi:papain family cysteine protease [Necator americanus]|uniref:Papain family cysteine protease n=1 Tax=Necator americanus TaxID=51031 RepID=W2T6A6_NECAM|nr:papain family cysteine protease [Necator americanus]ETN76701.1 papain family cysteine protease [Necator americanus]
MGQRWSARNYSFFWGRSLDEGIKYRLGTLFPEQSVQNMNEIVIKQRELPPHFDAREKWPGLIHEVRDQGDCGSSWAVSTTTISSDRLAIISDGRVNATISPQQLLSCNQHRQRGCEGGYLDRAWWYIRKLGVVDEQCYPYESGVTREPGDCRIPKRSYTNGNGLTCPAGASLDSTAYKMTPPYRVASREEDIMTEIITNGPVQATFVVHEDFFMYAGGVYRHTELAEEKGDRFTGQGYHSVRILGWGVDHSTGRDIPYWLAANSWGRQWGEDGLFRILRGDNHCEIESFVIGAWGKGAKRRRRFKMRKMRRRFRKL